MQNHPRVKKGREFDKEGCIWVNMSLMTKWQEQKVYCLSQKMMQYKEGMEARDTIACRHLNWSI